MSEFDNPTIPMTASPAAAVAPTPVPEQKQPASNRAIRFSIYGLLFASLLAVGWGAWHFLHSPARIDDEESIADLEGFEPITESTKKKIDEESRFTRHGRLSVPKPSVTSAATPAAMVPGGLSLPQPPGNLFQHEEPIATNSSTTDTLTGADVWLTGTIEDIETTDRLEFPQRLSGGPNEGSSILR